MAPAIQRRLLEHAIDNYEALGKHERAARYREELETLEER
jgi:hypothetical protein